MLLEFTLLDGTAIGVSPRFIAYAVPQGTGARITLADGSSKDVVDSFERVLNAAASAKKEKSSTA